MARRGRPRRGGHDRRVLAPGDVNPSGCVSLAGRLTVNGDVDLQAGATFQVQLGGLVPGVSYDQLKVNGFVDLTGLLDGTSGSLLDVSLTFGPLWGSMWRIVDNDAAEAIETRFQGLPECAFVWLGGTLANITYQGSDGTATDGHNDVVLTVAGPVRLRRLPPYTAATYTGVSPFQLKHEHERVRLADAAAAVLRAELVRTPRTRATTASCGTTDRPPTTWARR